MGDNGVDSAAYPTIAVIGTGPSGCYAAQAFRREWAESEIVMFDRLGLPYGLVRYGVAPDHIGTRAISKQFDRLFERDRVQFVGGVEVGTTISLADLRDAFDIVVLATGLSADRGLGIDGSELDGVYGAGTVTRLINGHPDEASTSVRLGKRIVIVGQGNVAIDLVRLLLRSDGELAELDVPAAVIRGLHSGPIARIDVVGRSAVETAKFDPAMVRELSKLDDVAFESDLEGESASDDTDAIAKRESVTSLPSGAGSAAGRTVAFHFGWVPDRIDGGQAVDTIAFHRTDGAGHSLVLEADSVLSAIGFEEDRAAPLQRRHHETVETDVEVGYLDHGLYVVGWLRRGPTGTIPVNRVDAKLVAAEAIAAVGRGEISPGKPGISSLNLGTTLKEQS
jgi:ferredoxin/flavodoxin---NADP+ reductase